MKPHDTRQDLIAAAGRVLTSGGVPALTLDAVAHEAGVSKGGLLYHFATKQELLEAMVADLLDRFEADITRRLGGERAGGDWTRAYVEARFAADQADHRVRAGLIAALATDPALMGVVRARYAGWSERAVGTDPVLTAVMRLAADGLWFAELFGLARPGGALRDEVRATILRLGTPGGPSTVPVRHAEGK